jgi:hypothetical protein
MMRFDMASPKPVPPFLRVMALPCSRCNLSEGNTPRTSACYFVTLANGNVPMPVTR